MTVDFLNEGVENAFPEYWDTIIGLVLQGNLELARILLQLHSQSDSDAFTYADKILRTIPIFSVSITLYLLFYLDIVYIKNTKNFL